MADQKIVTERTLFAQPGIRWGAVIGGWMFAYAIAMLLYLLGAAVGVTSLAVLNGFSKGVTLTTGVWMIFAWVLAAYIGSIFAGRSAGIPHRSTGAMHGVLVWALSGIMTLFLGTVQAAVAVKTGVNAAQGITQAAAKGGDAAGEAADTFNQTFEQEFKQQAGRAAAEIAGSNADREKVKTAVEKLDRNTISEVTAKLTLADTACARQTLKAKTDLSDRGIDSLVNGLTQGAGAYGSELKQKAGAAVEEAGDVTSAALWVMFLSSLLGLFAGAWGGSVGAAMAARNYVTEESYMKSDFTAYETEEQRRRRAG